MGKQPSNIIQIEGIGLIFLIMQVWGLSIAGETGVNHVMRALLAEFDILMECAGYPNLSEINRDALDSLPRVAYIPATPDMV